MYLDLEVSRSLKKSQKERIHNKLTKVKALASWEKNKCWLDSEKNKEAAMAVKVLKYFLAKRKIKGAVAILKIADSERTPVSEIPKTFIQKCNRIK